MEFKTQTSQQPQQAPAPAERTTVNSSSRLPSGSGSSGRRKSFALVVTAVVVLALLVGAFALWQWKSNSNSGTSGVEADKYQAVFMTNGQVYFGKLTNIENTYTELSDVYYLQVQQPASDANAALKKTDTQSQVSLTKLGNELHGPTDKMHISRDQVLFWENLKNDSTVVKAITDYKAKQ